jgi:hypothetical protein
MQKPEKKPTAAPSVLFRTRAVTIVSVMSRFGMTPLILVYWSKVVCSMSKRKIMKK